MDKIKEFAKALGQRGGIARAKKLSPEERKKIASMGGKARALSILYAKRIEENFRKLAEMREGQQKFDKKKPSQKE